MKIKSSPIPPFFFRDEMGQIQVSHNNQKIDIDEYEECLEALKVFCNELTDQSVLDWNKEVDQIAIKSEEIFVERNPKLGYVYLLKDNNLFKIGSTKNIENRVKNYRTHNSNDIALLWSHFTKDYQEVEEYLHNMFKEKRKVGEWFDLSDADVHFILNYAKNI